MGKINNLARSLRKGELKEKLVRICKENEVVFVSVFGSFARGEQKKGSDVDIAIEFEKNSKKDLLDLVHLEYEMKKILGEKVDLGIFSSISPHIIDDVKKEMKVIYEKR